MGFTGGNIAHSSSELQVITFAKDKLLAALMEMLNLLNELRLEFNEKTQVFPISHGVEYLGWRFGITEAGAVTRRLKVHSKIRWKHRLRKLRTLYAEDKMGAKKDSRKHTELSKSYELWKHLDYVSKGYG